MAFTRERTVIVDCDRKIAARTAPPRLAKTTAPLDRETTIGVRQQDVALRPRRRDNATRAATLDLSVQSKDVSEQVDPRLRLFIDAMAEALLNDMRGEREKK